MNDPYLVLGVARTATLGEITRAYRRQLRAHHPDLHSGSQDAGRDERLQRIIAAYALLRDPDRRAAYDRESTAHNGTRRIRVDGPAARRRAGPIRIPVNRDGAATPQPPLRAGPARWHRFR